MIIYNKHARRHPVTCRTVRQRRKSSSRVANVICTKGTRHGRPFGDQLKWQTVPGRRHGDPESSSELVNRPLSSLTTSNVPCPCVPRPATADRLLLHLRRRILPVRHRRLFCSQPTAIEFFLRKTNLLFLYMCHIHTHTHTDWHNNVCIYIILLLRI